MLPLFFADDYYFYLNVGIHAITHSLLTRLSRLKFTWEYGHRQDAMDTLVPLGEILKPSNKDLTSLR